MENCIIIIPSHKRQAKLPQCAWYYSHFEYPVYICDSTPGNPAVVPVYDNINYLHVPELGFYDKILHVLQTTDAIYYALSPDDDFLKAETLLECIENMELESRYSMAIGGQVFWDEGFYNKVFRYPFGSNKLEGRKIEGCRLKRYTSFWPNYQNVLWSLFKKDVVTEAFRQLKEAGYNNQNFIELTLGDVAISKGWVYVSKNALNYREYSLKEHWGKQVPEINTRNIKNDEDLKNDVFNYNKKGDKWRGFGLWLYASSNSGILYFFKRVNHFVKYRLLHKTVSFSKNYKDDDMAKLVDDTLHIA